MSNLAWEKDAYINKMLNFKQHINVNAWDSAKPNIVMPRFTLKKAVIAAKT